MCSGLGIGERRTPGSNPVKVYAKHHANGTPLEIRQGMAVRAQGWRLGGEGRDAAGCGGWEVWWGMGGQGKRLFKREVWMSARTQLPSSKHWAPTVCRHRCWEYRSGLEPVPVLKGLPGTWGDRSVNGQLQYSVRNG